MGVVYEAEHAMTRRRVAVKVLHAHHKESTDAAKRFLNEAQAAGKVSHPNVVEVLDAGEDTDGSLYLVLELLTGQDLATHLMRVRRLDVADAVTIIAQVLQALVVAHRQGIIHRDIKPENIFLTRSVTGDTHVKILDFGISKAIGPSEHGPALSVTQTNTTVGTPHYMSPEQARGERGIDTRADLWAVGVVLYEILAGRVPFDGETYNDQIVRVITEPHLPLSNFDVPLELSRIVDKALEKDRNRRYARAADMLGDIRRFIERHREYASVSPHLLREPAPMPPPMPIVRGDNPTIETSRDPNFDPSLPASSDTMPNIPSDHLASLFDAASEDAPTTVRMSADEVQPPGAPRLPPLAGTRGPGSPAAGAPVVASAASSPMSHADQRRRNLLIAATLLTGALVVGAIAAIASNRPRPSVTTPANAPSALVTLRFVGLPPGGRLVVGGIPITGSDTVIVQRSAAPTMVQVTAPGYQPLQFPITPSTDQTIPLVLQPLPPPPPVGAPAPTSSASGSGSSGSGSGGSATAEEHSGRSRGSSGSGGSAHGSSAPAPVAMGMLTVRAHHPCNVRIDGQAWGTTPLSRVSVGTGQHRVICQLPSGGLRSRNVSVNNDSETVVEFTP